MDSALYRRYRPQTFAEVIGQEHVTEPLMAALRSGRISHAFLFSGPRGCGKTSSARILARCLNCEQGPTDVPCGECESCQELGLGGRGSLDVVEIDAASHNGVDDARDLRERALANPTRDRFKIFILDEAHMVTPQGFNALLKIVEEPPPHVKFIFATTEADKVIGTIRSRTHHYPFRLVPPERMASFLGQLCTAEGIEVDDGVLPLVVRAGAGSVRDAESVLDQLMAGAEDGAIHYDSAVALLGYTPATLLDETVAAFAHDDGAALFSVIDQVIEAGQDPRRFAEDLLERMRDLIVLAAAGDKAAAVLHSVPADQLERMRATANEFGLARLSRAGDLVNEGLAAMTGATSPRLQLELLCARVLVPAGQEIAGPAADAAPVAPSAPRPVQPSSRSEHREAPSASGQPAAPAATAPPYSEPQAPAGPGARETQAAPPAAPAATAPPTSPPTDSPTDPTRPPEPAPAPGGDGAVPAEAISANWERLMDELSKIRKASWALVRDNASVLGVKDGTLILAFAVPGLASAFRDGGHAATVAEAIGKVFGTPLRVSATVEGGGNAGPPRPAPLVPRAAAPTSRSHEMPDGGGNVVPIGAARSGTPPTHESPDLPATPLAPVSPEASEPQRSLRVVRDHIAEEPTGTGHSVVTPPSPSPASPPSPLRPAAGMEEDDIPSEDDPELEGSENAGPAVVQKLLGGEIIEEEETDPDPR